MALWESFYKGIKGRVLRIFTQGFLFTGEVFLQVEASEFQAFVVKECAETAFTADSALVLCYTDIQSKMKR